MCFKSQGKQHCAMSKIESTEQDVCFFSFEPMQITLEGCSYTEGMVVFFGPAEKKKQEVTAAIQVVPAATQEVLAEMQEEPVPMLAQFLIRSSMSAFIPGQWRTLRASCF